MVERYKPNFGLREKVAKELLKVAEESLNRIKLACQF